MEGAGNRLQQKVEERVALLLASHSLLTLLVQGSEAVRALPPPEELLFTVDEKVRGDVSLAKQRYLESVSKDETYQCDKQQ